MIRSGWKPLASASAFQALKTRISGLLFGVGELGSEPGGEVSLQDEARNLYGLLNPSLAPGKGLVIQFIGANQGEGVSTIAREFALVASQYTAAPTLLLDFDWGRGVQERFFQLPSHLRDYGVPYPAPDWTLDSTRLLRSSSREESCQLRFMRVGVTHLVLGQLICADPSTIRICNVPEFWETVRGTCPITVVDSPSASRSIDGLTISGSMDAVVVVVAAESSRAHAVQHLCDKLRSQNAPIVGLVLNKRRFYIPQRLYRWMERL
jgi:Mrp family chromosome partitioning ATPase